MSNLIHPKKKIKLLREIVPIEDWIRDPYYIGDNVADSEDGSGMRDFWRDGITEFYTLEPPRSTLVLTGSNRSGKTYNGIHFGLRSIYEISCFENFPGLFGLARSSLVLFVALSLTKQKSEDSLIPKILSILETIPYFNIDYPYNKNLKSKIVFPTVEIRPGASTNDLVSEDLFGIWFDEANILKTAKDQEFATAKRLFLEGRARGQLTFSMGGISRGFFCAISSADSTSSFVESLVNDSKADNSGFVLNASVYKVSPEKFRQDAFFYVFCGVDEVPPHIIDDVTEETKLFVAKNYGMTYEQFLEVNKAYIEKIPLDLKKIYVEDVVYGLRYLSGRPTNMSGGLLKNRAQFEAMFKPSLKSPLLVQIPTLSLMSDDLIEDFIDEETLMELYPEGAPAYVHIDLGLVGDATGKTGDFASISATSMTPSNKLRTWLYCRIARASQSDEIDSAKVESVIYWLINLGVSIKIVSKDLLARGYFSQRLLTRLGKERVIDFSLDKSADPFLVVMQLMKKGLLETYNYPPFRSEFPTLIYDRASHKVLKANNGHDDISQAWIGSNYQCYIGEGIDLAALAAEEALTKESHSETTPDFYRESLNFANNDDFYSKVLNEVDNPDAQHDNRMDQETPDDDEVFRKQISDEERRFDDYGFPVMPGKSQGPRRLR